VQSSFMVMVHRNGIEHHGINAPSDINLHHHRNQWKQNRSRAPLIISIYLTWHDCTLTPSEYPKNRAVKNTTISNIHEYMTTTVKPHDHIYNEPHSHPKL
jgi:hypothetical protein